LFERAYAAEVGTVLGPDPEGESWAVTRVEAIHPARIPLFEEVRDAVRARWLEERTAAQLRAALDRERRRTSITRYPDRLDFVTMTDAETR
jgi:parvulin-like peptidyl-prolyl isomerase